MFLRVWTSLNWVIGVLTLGVAALYPLYVDAVNGQARRVAEETAQRIAHAERAVFESRGRHSLSYYRAAETAKLQAELRLDPPIDTAADFTWDVYGEEGAALVIRAVTSPAALRTGRLPPMMYVIKAPRVDDLPGHEETLSGGRWEPLSGSKAGLYGVVGRLTGGR